MTEQELNRIMWRVLIDSLKMDDERAEKDQDPSFEPTSRYKRRMRTMLENPLSWLNWQEHPRWQQIVRRAVIILLTCAVAFGGVMAFSPTARAAVVRWVVEWYENIIDYVYMGEQNSEALPQYEIAELPDVYVETIRNVAPGLVAVTYENSEGDAIYFVYSFMHQGSQTNFILENEEVYDVMVNEMRGQFFESHSPESLNSLTWIDTDLNIQFNLDCRFGIEELLHMAESAFLCKVTK